MYYNSMSDVLYRVRITVCDKCRANCSNAARFSSGAGMTLHRDPQGQKNPISHCGIW